MSADAREAEKRAAQEVDLAFRLSEEAWGRVVRAIARGIPQHDLDGRTQEWTEASERARAALNRYEDHLRGWTV